jgi:hypothetical protein
MKARFINKLSDGLMLISIIILLAVGSTFCSYKLGYKLGKVEGFGMALDTVNKILKERLKEDKGVTKLIISDTTQTYYISKKIIK